MKGKQTFDIALGRAGQTCSKFLRAIDPDEATDLEFSYEFEMAEDSLHEIQDLTVLQDLPAPNVESITDKYQKWESNLPFKRTIFEAFKRAVNRAEAQDGGKGYVTLV